MVYTNANSENSSVGSLRPFGGILCDPADLYSNKQILFCVFYDLN